ncbi:MAG: hypothetical protein LLF82_000936 [Dehalococcoides mccartyi]|nr:hypothetical protein [Dehalococcoides mccartyi]MEA2123125.1 hypothetical protein [Dehalococcoides mccartyi]
MLARWLIGVGTPAYSTLICSTRAGDERPVRMPESSCESTSSEAAIFFSDFCKISFIILTLAGY